MLTVADMGRGGANWPKKCWWRTLSTVPCKKCFRDWFKTAPSEIFLPVDISKKHWVDESWFPQTRLPYHHQGKIKTLFHCFFVNLIWQVGKSYISVALFWCGFHDQWNLSFNLFSIRTFTFLLIATSAFLIWGRYSYDWIFSHIFRWRFTFDINDYFLWLSLMFLLLIEKHFGFQSFWLWGWGRCAVSKKRVIEF